MPPFRSARGLGGTAPASSPCWPSNWARAMPPSPPPKRQRKSRRQTLPELCAPVGKKGDVKLVFINSILYLLVEHDADGGLDGGLVDFARGFAGHADREQREHQSQNNFHAFNSI